MFDISCLVCKEFIASRLDQVEHLHILGSGEVKFKAPFCSFQCIGEYYGGKTHKNLRKINEELVKHVKDSKKREKALEDAEKDHTIVKIDHVDLKLHDFTKEEMGSVTWTFLTLYAQNYPDEPSETEQELMQQLLNSAFRLYPCLNPCRIHFLTEVLPNLPPIDTSTGLKVRQWVCNAHNAVNVHLGKPIFPCECIETNINKFGVIKNCTN